MKWRQDLNTSEDLGDKVRFCVYAEGEGLTLSVDENKTWMKPNCSKNGVDGFDITVEKSGKHGQSFVVSEWGYLEFPNIQKQEPNSNPPIIVESNFGEIDFHKYIKIRDFVNEFRNEYFEKYKSMLKSMPDGEPKVAIEFPSNTISYHKRGEQGTIIRSTVSLYDESGRLLIQSSGDGAIAGTKPWGNNHGAYYHFPEGKYRVVISNDGNNGVGDESWILAEAFRQDSNSNSGYHEFGEPRVLQNGESCEYWMDCFDKGQPSLLFKINNVSR